MIEGNLATKSLLGFMFPGWNLEKIGIILNEQDFENQI